jgi:hypothetical protein
MISIQRSWTERVFGTLGKIPNTGISWTFASKIQLGGPGSSRDSAPAFRKRRR